MSLPKWAEQALNTQESQIEKLESRIKSLTSELKAANSVITDYRVIVNEQSEKRIRVQL